MTKDSIPFTCESELIDFIHFENSFFQEIVLGHNGVFKQITLGERSSACGIQSWVHLGYMRHGLLKPGFYRELLAYVATKEVFVFVIVGMFGYWSVENGHLYKLEQRRNGKLEKMAWDKYLLRDYIGSATINSHRTGNLITGGVDETCRSEINRNGKKIIVKLE